MIVDSQDMVVVLVQGVHGDVQQQKDKCEGKEIEDMEREALENAQGCPQDRQYQRQDQERGTHLNGPNLPSHGIGKCKSIDNDFISDVSNREIHAYGKKILTV